MVVIVVADHLVGTLLGQLFVVLFLLRVEGALLLAVLLLALALSLTSVAGQRREAFLLAEQLVVVHWLQRLRNLAPARSGGFC